MPSLKIKEVEKGRTRNDFARPQPFFLIFFFNFLRKLLKPSCNILGSGIIQRKFVVEKREKCTSGGWNGISTAAIYLSLHGMWGPLCLCFFPS